MTIESLRLSWSEGCNIVIGQSHFIKTVEDLGEIMARFRTGRRVGARIQRGIRTMSRSKLGQRRKARRGSHRLRTHRRRGT